MTGKPRAGERAAGPAARLADLVVPVAAAIFIRVVGRTTRLRLVGHEQLAQLQRAGTGVIYALWHNRVFFACYMLQGKSMHALVSSSRDGELIARTVRMFGIVPVRGSTSRGGARGLLELVRSVGGEYDGAVTPDGPGGPRYRVQPGVIHLASRTGSPIVPVSWDVRHRRRLSSWDGFLLPMPFSSGVFMYGAPVKVPADVGGPELERWRKTLESALQDLTERAEAAVAGGRVRRPLEARLAPVLDGSRRDLRARLLRVLLAAASVVYRALHEGRRALYDWRIIRRRHAGCCVISVGNLVVGGSGKTPLVELVARKLAERGRKVAVLSRGYGRRSREAVEVVSDGERVLLDARRGGDEPVLLARNMPGVAVVVGRDRWKAARLARSRLGSDVFVLDDGFQHWRLARDLDIVAVAAGRGFAPGFLLPRGLLREPLSALSRAGLVCLVRRGDTSVADGLPELIRKYNRGVPIVELCFEPSQLEEMPSGRISPLSSLQGLDVMALSGVGDPGSFDRVLGGLGAHVASKLSFADHHPYSEEDIHLVRVRAREASIGTVITTQKDAVRLPVWPDSSPRLLVLAVRMEVLRGEDTFLEMLSRALEPRGE